MLTLESLDFCFLLEFNLFIAVDTGLMLLTSVKPFHRLLTLDLCFLLVELLLFLIISCRVKFLVSMLKVGLNYVRSLFIRDIHIGLGIPAAAA